MKASAKRRSGQAILFLILVVVILAFVVLWIYDLHKVLHVKALSQNAGDAAAVMAARWQGIALNLIGDLNLLQALALTQGDAEAAAGITNLQARLCYVGPMIAFAASQAAAKLNGLYRHTGFDAFIREHAETVRRDYTTQIGDDGEPLFPEPYEGCWEEYAEMLEWIADQGIAAGPDNARLYSDRAGGHILLRIDFYEAVAGRLWCWFYHHAPTLLQEYTSYRWWPPLPPIERAEYINSEIFGLGLVRRTTSLSELTSLDTVTALASQRELRGPISNVTSATWYCYDPAVWGPWEAMRPPFPLTGLLKPQYDYAGADAAVRIETHTQRVTPAPGGGASSQAITWSAAAKPFGYLGDADPPTRYALVLPAYREARLIPVDASAAPSGGGFNLEWRRHIEEHLPEYLAHGPGRTDCWYCLQLITWEDPAFRRAGVEWLRQYSDRCRSRGGGGGGGSHGGGTRRGH